MAITSYRLNLECVYNSCNSLTDKQQQIPFILFCTKFEEKLNAASTRPNGISLSLSLSIYPFNMIDDS